MTKVRQLRKTATQTKSLVRQPNEKPSANETHTSAEHSDALTVAGQSGNTFSRTQTISRQPSPTGKKKHTLSIYAHPGELIEFFQICFFFFFFRHAPMIYPHFFASEERQNVAVGWSKGGGSGSSDFSWQRLRQLGENWIDSEREPSRRSGKLARCYLERRAARGVVAAKFSPSEEGLDNDAPGEERSQCGQGWTRWERITRDETQIARPCPVPSIPESPARQLHRPAVLLSSALNDFPGHGPPLLG